MRAVLDAYCGVKPGFNGARKTDVFVERVAVKALLGHSVAVARFLRPVESERRLCSMSIPARYHRSGRREANVRSSRR